MSRRLKRPARPANRLDGSNGHRPHGDCGCWFLPTGELAVPCTYHASQRLRQEAERISQRARNN
ncbi:hypothetical protein KOR42_10740 [Thalassoglobus neptunius]|uniref:Uncharacterized protein n=1 Tax=Thalassoglobus neptunius TaxID=1938619 RepID=A0A5C5WGB0_9PLAN|nr:hypothetical protein [Thalassoglobus neptunius]TWT49053.1 hypothetical protein KOR42_39690 [Thalassoglobus neptunius]TWT57710.1 hypothetical protein KOR42_10740 [Thalassoglobus neptunius]